MKYDRRTQSNRQLRPSRIEGKMQHDRHSMYLMGLFLIFLWVLLVWLKTEYNVWDVAAFTLLGFMGGALVLGGVVHD